MTTGMDEFLASMDLAPTGSNSWTAANTAEGYGVIFGGQLLAQTIVAAGRAMEAKQVRSIHTVFARGGDSAQDVTITVDPMHEGRSFGSVTVSIAQGDRLCCRSLVLLDAPDEDLVRNEIPMPDVGEAPDTDAHGWWQTETVGGVDLADPTPGPAQLAVWSRFPKAPKDLLLSQALLAFATDGFLIGTAMRPHEGLDQTKAHVSVATTVLTHTLSFHQDLDASDWLLLSQENIHASAGRVFGRGIVHDTGRRHVASFVQDAMLRAMPEAKR